jgi:hypothetical protein
MSRKLLVPFQLPADPTLALEAATKQYVDLQNEVIISASDPIGTNPQAELWIDTVTNPPAAPLASAISFSPTGTIAATNVQSAIAEVAAEYASVPWITPTLINSWAAYGLGWSLPGYRKIGDVVYIRGLYKNGALGTTLFTLPAGYTPAQSVIFSIRASDANGQARILSGGSVEMQFGTIAGGWASFDGISFSTLA